MLLDIVEFIPEDIRLLANNLTKSQNLIYYNETFTYIFVTKGSL